MPLRLSKRLPHPHDRRNGPERLSLSPQRDHFADRRLLGLVRGRARPHHRAGTRREPCRQDTGHEPFDRPDALANAVALRLGKGGSESRQFAPRATDHTLCVVSNAYLSRPYTKGPSD